MPTRKAEAEWKGNFKEGGGTIKFGNFSGPYSFASRFESGSGTNPEELLGAAHAGCFSMALTAGLVKAGINPKRVKTVASVTIDNGAIQGIALDCEAEVPGLDDAKFQEHANAAKEGCPISKALKAVPITLKAKLV